MDLTPSGAAASSGAVSPLAAAVSPLAAAVSPLAAAAPPLAAAELPLDQTNLEDDPEMVTQPTQIPDPDSLPQLSTIFQTYKPTLSWVPAAVSADFSREFGSIAEKLAADTEAIHLWKMFFMFPFVILTGGRKDRRARRPGGGLSQVQLLKERLRRWREGEAGTLWNEAVKASASARRKTNQNRRKKPTNDEQAEFNAKKAAQEASEGNLAKALQTLTSSGLAPTTAANFERMVALHPPAPIPQVLHTEEQQIQVSAAEVKKSIMLMKNGSSAGPCGHKPSHWKAVVSEAALGRRDRTLAAITRLVNRIAAGAVPDSVRPLLSSAILYGVPKKCGGIRPVACGTLLRRITAKTIARKLMEKAANLFSPLQVGVGVRNSCEGIIHSVRMLVEADPTLWVCQTDLRSAFNECNRDSIMEGVQQHFPELLEFTKVCYGLHSSLFYGEFTLTSQKGTHQGDPLGSMLFCLVLHPIIQEIARRVPRLPLHVWMADDGCLLGRRDDLRAAVNIITEKGPARGLHLSTDLTAGDGLGKTTVWSPQFGADVGSDPLGCGTKKVEEEGIKLLGAPIGSETFVHQFLAASVAKIKKTTSELVRLQDTQTQYCLLRSTLALTKWGYLIRTVPCTPHTSLLREFDANTRSSLNDLMGCVLSNTGYLQATLPVSCSGLGLRKSVDHHPAAYCASVTNSLDLVLDLCRSNQDVDDNPEEVPRRLLTPAVLASLAASIGEEVNLAELLAGTSQKILSRRIDERNYQILLDLFAESVRDRARLAALTLPHSRDFLNAVPCRKAGFYLRNDVWTSVVKYQLGEPIYDTDFTCPSCHHQADRMGHHSYVCGSGGEQISRHNALREGLIRLAREAGQNPQREARFLLPGLDRRPADLLIPFGTGTEDLALDVCVTASLRDDVIARGAEEPGYAASLAHNRKVRQVGAICSSNGIRFEPIAVENLGGFTESAIRIITKIARDKAIRADLDINKTVSSTFKMLSVLLQRGNAQLLLNRCIVLNEPLPDVDIQNPM